MITVKRYLPFFTALFAVIISIIFMEDIMGLFTKNEVSFSGVYSAVFDWSAIQTGFLFSVLGYIGGKDGGFISTIRGTPAMDDFINRIKRATFIGFILTIVTMPLVMFNPSVYSSSLIYSFIVAWFGLFIWAFLSFFRVAFEFGRIITVKTPPRD